MSNPLAFVIEDDEDHIELFSEALRKAGFDIEVIPSGENALARLAESTPNLVVLDLHLPNVSGADILHHIRSTPRLAKIRVMIVSADTQMAAMLRDKADLTLTKPVSYFQLRELAVRLRATDSPKG